MVNILLGAVMDDCKTTNKTMAGIDGAMMSHLLYQSGYASGSLQMPAKFDNIDAAIDDCIEHCKSRSERPDVEER